MARPAAATSITLFQLMPLRPSTICLGQSRLNYGIIASYTNGTPQTATATRFECRPV